MMDSHRALTGRVSRRALLRGAGLALGAGAIAAACRDGGDDERATPTMTADSTPTPTSNATPDGGRYFPPLTGDEWETVAASEAGWDAGALDELAAWAGSVNTTSLLLLHRGRVLLERYFGSADQRSMLDVASAQKSVVSFLVGVAQEEGLLDIDDAVSQHLGAAWSQAPPDKEALITLRHLVTMSSGLDDQWAYVADAGTAWYYNNTAYHLSKRVLERVSGESITLFLEERLGTYIGLQQTQWRERPFMKMPDGVPMTGLFMSARDMARFGLLMLAGGSWQGDHVMADKGYLSDSVDTSQEMNLSYGYLWWLNGKASHMLPGPAPRVRQGPLIPTAPDDVYAAMGAGDQRIYVAPGLELVVVRQGSAAFGAAAARSPFDAELWTRIMAAAPA